MRKGEKIMFKKMLVAIVTVIACYKIGEIKGFVGGVNKSFDKLKDENLIDELTVDLPIGKNFAITVKK